MGQWNSSSCNSQGVSFPYFLDSGPGDININVYFKPGVNTRNPSVCAEFTRDGPTGSVTGGRIDLYEQWDNAGVLQSCQTGRTQVISDRIAHELGHVLGLANSPCLSHIMGSASWSPSTGFSTSRSIQGEECGFADTNNHTALEDTGCDPGNQDCGSQEIGSPILIDLDRNNFHLSGLDDAVYFDIDADGDVEPTGWTSAGSRDALLVLDRNGDGIVNDASELFGDSTPLLSGGVAAHGYAALAELDAPENGGNGNFAIDPGDAIYDDLKLWIDTNHDGFSESTELWSLAEIGLERLDLDFRESPRRDRYGNLLRYLSSGWLRIDGSLKRCAASDVFFVFWDP